MRLVRLGRNLKSLGAAVLVIAAWSPAAVAQQSIVKEGATVRFRLATSDAYRQGQVSRLTADSLILDRCGNCGDRLRYTRAELVRLDVSRRVGNVARIGKGGLLGGLAGIVTGSAAAASCHGGPRCENAAEAVPFLFLLGAAAGGIAAYLSSYIWDPVPQGASSQPR